MPRSVAYSGKQKKAQLKQKRQSKTRKTPLTLNIVNSDDEDDKTKEPQEHSKSGAGDGHKLNRHEKFKLLFQSESREQLQKAKEVAQTQVVEFDELNCRLDRQHFHSSHSIDYPRRPDWGDANTPRQINQIESEAFGEYLEHIHNTYDSKSLSYFEHNLETWRQLWRLIETADVVVIVADSRHPVLHFPPSLYQHLKELNKKCILCLSKIDLIRPEVYVAWKDYLTSQYPDLSVVGFTCFDRFAYRENKNIQQKRSRTVKFGNQFGSQLGPVELGEAIKQFYPDEDLTEWLSALHELNENSDNPDRSVGSSTSSDASERIKIGFVGHTNVGKSSIMNTLVGEKHFSMSIRPGHTKQLQTWDVASNVTLIDSPGLIFPSYYPKELQILSGLFPIDQVRTPFTAVGYLAERVNLVRAFQLKHLSDDDDFTPWDICEAFAQKKGFMVARKRYPDASRGANLLLRMAVQGQIVMSFTPPGFLIENWHEHDEVRRLKSMAAKDHNSRRVAQQVKSDLSSRPNSSSSSEESESENEPVVNRFALLDED